MRTEQEFLQALYRYFGLNEALRSDQSYEALSEQISEALNAWPAKPAESLSVRWTFADRVIATAWVEMGDRSEWYAWEIPYMVDETGAFTFGTPMRVDQVQLFEPVAESRKPTGKGQRITETIEQRLSVISEAQSDGGRKVKAVGITADVVNGNRRRYPRAVLATAIAKLNGQLHESNGQGRLIATGEVEHPGDKSGRPNLLETVVKWEAASLDSTGKVLLEGVILPTSKGKDMSTLIEHGIPVGVSMRGYGEWNQITESGQTIQQVSDLTIKGFDLVAQPSDPNGQVVESQRPQEKKKMNLEELLKFLAEKPEMKEAIIMEVGDTLWYISALATELGVPLEDLAYKNIEKLTGRKIRGTIGGSGDNR